jgi:hypothetical protein
MKSGLQRKLHSFSALAFVLALSGVASAADHGDTPALVSANRRDALISDLHAFVRDQRLVLSLCTNTAIPVGATSYLWPSDLTLKIMVDRDCAVDFGNPSDMATYGGTVMNPAGIAEDVMFKVTFPDGATPQLTTTGLSAEARSRVRIFAGLRDDPFIRGPRQGRTVAAVVIELPLNDVATIQPTLLIWATSHVPDVSGDFQELAGRALRNMFPENDAMNAMHPNQHTAMMAVPPDVIIYNTKLAARFPNGRELTDDVVDLVGDTRVTTTDAPYPSANDVPFLAEFPYLGFARGLEPPPVPALSVMGMAALGMGMLLALAGTLSRGRQRP